MFESVVGFKGVGDHDGAVVAEEGVGEVETGEDDVVL